MFLLQEVTKLFFRLLQSLSEAVQLLIETERGLSVSVESLLTVTQPALQASDKANVVIALAAVISAIAAIFAIWSNMIDRNLRERPYLTLRQVRFISKNRETLEDGPALINVGLGPAIDIKMSAVKSVKPKGKKIIVSPPGPYQLPVLMQNDSIAASDFSTIVTTFLRYLSLENKADFERGSPDAPATVTCTVDCIYFDRGGKLYHQELWFEAKSDFYTSWMKLSDASELGSDEPAIKREGGDRIAKALHTGLFVIENTRMGKQQLIRKRNLPFTRAKRIKRDIEELNA